MANRTVVTFNRDVQRKLATIGDVNSDEMKAAGRVLARAWRKVLGVRGSGRPGAPGDAPRKQSGKLARSVATGVVGSKRRVAVTRFTGPILEAGVDTTAKRRGGSRRRKGGQANRKVVIAPRPSRDRAIALARDEMVAVFVDTTRSRLER